MHESVRIYLREVPSSTGFLQAFSLKTNTLTVTQGGAALALGWFPPGLRPENQEISVAFNEKCRDLAPK